ncbi:catechol 2,3-dioxygenase [Beggiatoa leptomitoformis]|uniref:Metapyrocatechase n=1 Tax=Beggiatoa leptomitoformis TaxID=288004 RepID=A0A2N9YC86_9GAMM|nr:catechol 2,3-dioxygenase [Beggiatoa leptomitoformis]ALG66619.1 catechol 2,3-dioxygenase [Beggiatoa leptomitoformis]AUI68071.1 catechol 2,3-dioxygenase [Beggiatoa leptomitoformis]
MAMNGVLRPGFVQLRVLDMQESLHHYCNLLGLEEVSREADGRIYLKVADEFDHHSIILREADKAGIDMMAFKVASDSDLDRFAQRIIDYGMTYSDIPAGEQPHVGRRISFIIPSGHRIELYAEMAISTAGPQIQNPNIWLEPPRGMRTQRFDHTLLYGPHIDKVLDFFVNVLDFNLTEKVELPDGLLAIWLTCSTKAHDIAFVKHPEPDKLHHVSFYLESWHDVGHAADIISRYNISLDIGPTRHGITRGQTIYFFDPSGNRNEVFAGGYTYYPDNPVRIWDESELGKAIFYYEKALNERFLGVVT